MEKIFWQNTDSITLLEQELKKDSICITSTDTVLGFLAASTEKSFQKLQSLKGERDQKPFVILVENIFSLKKFVDMHSISNSVMTMLERCWPGPVTVVFRAGINCPSFCMSSEGTIALRSPDHHGLQKLLASYDGLFSTSANRSGKPVPINPEQIDQKIVQSIKYLVLDSDRHSMSQTPSTILDCSRGVEQGIRVIREGAFPIHELEDYYGSPFNS
ncbi:MAG: Sua5/YciO/YrdC/YwlC family protein [bacterium]